MSKPKSISVSQRVKEYPDECFVVSTNKFFCTACKEEVSIKKSIIIHHIKSEKQGKSSCRIKANMSKTLS